MIKKLYEYILELLEAEKLDLLAEFLYIIESKISTYKDGEEDIENLKYEILANRELVEFLCDKELYIELLDYKIKKDNSKHKIYDKKEVFNHDVFGKGKIVIENLNGIYSKYNLTK